MTELFDIGESLSPRLAWMKKYRIRVDSYPPEACAEFCFDPFEIYSACEGIRYYGTGDTEDEAIANFARKNNLRLWNEE